jgi:hypothetical protein
VEFDILASFFDDDDFADAKDEEDKQIVETNHIFEFNSDFFDKDAKNKEERLEENMIRKESKEIKTEKDDIKEKEGAEYNYDYEEGYGYDEREGYEKYEDYNYEYGWVRRRR